MKRVAIFATTGLFLTGVAMLPMTAGAADAVPHATDAKPAAAMPSTGHATPSTGQHVDEKKTGVHSTATTTAAPAAPAAGSATTTVKPAVKGAS